MLGTICMNWIFDIWLPKKVLFIFDKLFYKFLRNFLKKNEKLQTENLILSFRHFYKSCHTHKILQINNINKSCKFQFWIGGHLEFFKIIAIILI